MAFEQRNGSGALFKNDKKGNEKAPDYTGNALSPTGEYFELSAWIKEGQKGKFMSIALKPKFGSEGQSRPASKSPASLDDMGDLDIPF
jgi:hypothetical protein